ncbi:MAG TPA: tRNA (adenosine(37)-N6)-threonylcarbamoyltransferase complex dimerization subunit type 1 TsaB [Candidatus Sulfotelmatobacter sp.]|jgi:tRNA threonylcarbamoyladenosine biosynthesis protein TsaB|nr:tRNA (adenosine(37)-N6)-threonylcarbamoyltransferase complex dimerization subunit type 1 TsaB [Candidatus Sulfotelmatobacter sp.]
MLLLVTDTSGKNGCVALARATNGSDNVEVIESVPLAGGNFSAQLVPQISALLVKHGFGKSDIDAFVVASGPGSFTGLRVGLAAIKALAEILAKPIVSVSLLEVAAAACGCDGRLIAVIDAGRGEVYTGEYEASDGAARMLREQLLSKAEFVESARGLMVGTSDTALAKFAGEAGLSVREIGVVDAEMIARLGIQKLRAGEIVAPDKLDANYIRRSAGEIFGKPGY